MKVLQFAFNGDSNNPYLPENIQGNSWVVYTGTHDNPTTLSWWDGLDKNKLLKLKSYYKKNSILKSLATEMDVASSVYHFLTNSKISGEIMTIDSGYSLYR